MKLLRRFLAPLLALCFALTSAPVGALPPARTAAILSGVQGWSFPGSSADLYFSRNAGSCAIQRIAKPCASLLTTTRASTGYAQWADGHLSSFAANVSRITDLGLLVEQAATNVVLWNRDLTNAAWTKSNITAALNQTGADGTANAATSLTATAGNGTCLQAITLASSARFQSAWVKRIAGTGTINMTMDNGATWTAITVTAVYTQLTIPTQTLANPTVGFRIVTSGDAIAVDLVGNETGTFATSPIATTTVAVTRAADNVSGGLGSWFNPAAGTLLVQLAPKAIPFQGTGQFASINDGSTNNRLQLYGNAGESAPVARVLKAGVDQYIGVGPAVTAATNFKFALSYAAASFASTANGATPQTQASGSVPSGLTTLGFSISGSYPNDYIKRFAYFPSVQSVQAITRLP